MKSFLIYFCLIVFLSGCGVSENTSAPIGAAVVGESPSKYYYICEVMSERESEEVANGGFTMHPSTAEESRWLKETDYSWDVFARICVRISINE